ncbi:MAG: MarR family transcriptional regulator [Acidimicrobiales bacterium]|nr:MarR family transcriptional regulator [Acidimicrobiales bacterium]
MAHPAPTVQPVNDFTDALVRVVRFATLPRFTERVAEEAGTHLDRSAYVLLAYLVEDRCRVGELAEHLCLDVSTVSRQVHALEQRGLLGREPHPTDRRGSVVGISPQGRKVVEQHRGARQELFAELLSDIPPAELETVTSVLDELASRIETLAGA